MNRTIQNNEELMDGETIEVECVPNDYGSTTVEKTRNTTQFVTCQRDVSRYNRVVTCYTPCNTSSIYENLNNNTMLSSTPIIGVGQQQSIELVCQDNFASSVRTAALDITCNYNSSAETSSLSGAEVDIEDLCYALPLIKMVPLDSEDAIKVEVSMDMSFDRSFDQAFDSVLKDGWCRLNKTDSIANSDLNGTSHFKSFEGNPFQRINYLNISNPNLTYGSLFNMTCGLNWSNLKMDSLTGLEVNFHGRMNPPALVAETWNITLQTQSSIQIEFTGTNLATLTEWYPTDLSFLIEISLNNVENVIVHDLQKFTIDGGRITGSISIQEGVISEGETGTVTVTSLRDGKKGGTSVFTSEVEAKLSSSTGMSDSFFVVAFIFYAWFIAY